MLCVEKGAFPKVQSDVWDMKKILKFLCYGVRLVFTSKRCIEESFLSMYEFYHFILCWNL